MSRQMPGQDQLLEDFNQLTRDRKWIIICIDFFVYIYMYVNICTYLYIYLHMNKHTYGNTSLCKYIDMYIYIYIFV
jgi:hypothetical protein